MAAVEPADTDSGDLLSERVAGGILPKVLNSFDMVAIFVAIVLFITNAAVIQSAGRRTAASAAPSGAVPAAGSGS